MTRADRQVAFLTYSGRPDLSDDDRLAADALRCRGWSVVAHPWDRPGSLAPYAAAIVRSTWNYHRVSDAFRSWLREAVDPTRLWNPPELLAWNSDKSRYLPELAASGIETPDSLFLPKDSPVSLAEAMRHKCWTDGAVFKPSTSASAYGTAWVPTVDEAARFEQPFAKLLAEGGMLIQPFLPEVRDGEWSLIFFNDGSVGSSGQFSHSVLKRPADGDFRVQDDYGGTVREVPAAQALVEQARRITQQIPHPWLYARVDGIVRGGALCLMELELIEPCLFFSKAPGSADRFAAAVEAVLSSSQACDLRISRSRASDSPGATSRPRR